MTTQIIDGTGSLVTRMTFDDVVGSAGTASTNVISVQGIANAVAIVMGGDKAAGTTDGGNPMKVGGYGSNSIPTAVTNGQRVNAWYSLTGATVLGGYDATGGSDGVGNAAAQVMGTGGNPRNLAVLAYLYNGSTQDKFKKPNLINRLLSSAATTNATSVKTSAGDVYRIQGNNTVASKRYLKLYNKASAPTVGTDTPVMTIVLLDSAAFDFNFGANGTYFSTGIAYAITANAADSDNTAIGAGDIECFNLVYTG